MMESLKIGWNRNGMAYSRQSSNGIKLLRSRSNRINSYRSFKKGRYIWLCNKMQTLWSWETLKSIIIIPYNSIDKSWVMYTVASMILHQTLRWGKLTQTCDILWQLLKLCWELSIWDRNLSILLWSSLIMSFKNITFKKP